MKHIFLIAFVFISIAKINCQETTPLNLQLTLNEVIEVAKQQSLDAFKSKNMYLSNYWEYRGYKASMLPGLYLEATPISYNQGIKSFETDSGKVEKYGTQLSSYGTLSLSQPLKYTGGTFKVKSSINYYNDESRKEKESFNSNPMLSISYEQEISGYNALKWRSKLAPIAFQKAKIDYITSTEDIASASVTLFFSLISSQINLRIADTNYSNADTLYRIAKGRFEIGTITQDELLDLELGLLNAKTSLTSSKLALKRAQKKLNTYLMMDQSITIECIPPEKIPSIKIDFENALNKSLQNNPLALQIKQANIGANRDVAKAKSEQGLTGKVDLNYGTTSNGSVSTIEDIYRYPVDYKVASLKITVPILDWGVRRGAFLKAKSQREVTRLQNEQAWTTFEQNLLMNVMSFNLQSEQVATAAKADTVSQLGYEVTKQRFMIGKVDVTRLNAAQTALEKAKEQYVKALENYWSYFYTLRKSTLYDFEQQVPLTEDLDKLLEESTL